MKLKWIDKKSVLKGNKKTFKFGDMIPDGFLQKSRINHLLSENKIEVIEKVEKPEIIEDEIKVEKPKKEKSKKKKTADLDQNKVNDEIEKLEDLSSETLSDLKNPGIEEDQE